ncbi:hypothetical protein FQN49_001545, partial [Arthroderma sp. PD_2]
AWGNAEAATSLRKLKKALKDNPDSAISTLRILIGSILYHRDPAIARILKDEKTRVGVILRQLDSEMQNHKKTTTYTTTPTPTGMPSTKTVSAVTVTATYDAWKSQSLEAEWNTFMNSKYATAYSGTTKPIYEYVEKLKDMYATKALIDEAQDEPNDTKAELAAKKKKRELINKIEKLDAYVSKLPTWPNPF